MFIFDVRKQKWTVLSVRLSLRVTQASGVCCKAVGPYFSRLCLRAAGAERPSCGVRARSWNHPNPLLQLQHLLARHNQSEGRAASRDKSACSVIFSGDPCGGVGTKANPHHPKTLALHPPSPSSPTAFWLWYLRPLRGGIASPVHTPTHTPPPYE